MKNLAQQIDLLKAKEQQLHDALHIAEAKEVNALLKRLGEKELSYDEIFDIYLKDNYPLDKDNNNAPYAQPDHLSDVTLIYLYVRRLPYIKAKRHKWYEIHSQLIIAKEALK